MIDNIEIYFIDFLTDFLNTRRFDKRRFNAFQRKYSPNFPIVVTASDLKNIKKLHPIYTRVFKDLSSGEIDLEFLLLISKLESIQDREKVFSFVPFPEGPILAFHFIEVRSLVDLIHQRFFQLFAYSFLKVYEKIRCCETCEVFFAAERRSTRYCSDRCRYQFHNQKKRKASKTKK
jgi:hypothetical protein